MIQSLVLGFSVTHTKPGSATISCHNRHPYTGADLAGVSNPQYPKKTQTPARDAIKHPRLEIRARNLPAAARLNKRLCEPQIRACMQMRIPRKRIFDEQPVSTVFYPDPALKPDRKDRIIRNICY